MTASQLTVFPPEPTLTASPSADQPDLPRGWLWVKLGDVVNKIFDGPFGSNLKTVDYIDQPGYQVIRLENVGYMEFIGHKVTFISEQKFTLLEKHEIYEGDIIFSSFIGDIVRTTVIPKLKYRAINKADCFCIRINPDKVDRHFIVYALSRRETQKAISLGVHGATRPRINTTYLKNFKLPIPPLAEQQRIVAKIEELFSEINAGVREVEAALQRLKTYRQAVLHHYLSNDEWEQVTIGSIAFVGTGITPLKSKKQFYEGGTIPWITSGALNDTFVSQASEYITEIALKETRLKIYPEGTLLVALYGEGKTRGKSSELSIEATINQAIAAILLKFEYVPIKPFLKFFLLKNYEKIRKLSSGGVQPNLNLAIIKATEIPLPDLDTQTRVVQEIEARLSEADALEKTLLTELQRAERLRQSVLKQAFSGTLLKTDVPASLPA